jgi:ectoine hydroxylase-related dioxygenase (phytanoyl-CoA dioxygenase family)
VALTPAHAGNGGLVVWPFDGAAGDTLALELEPGDAVVLHPRLPHASGFNREGGIRTAVYFRFLDTRAD